MTIIRRTSYKYINYFLTSPLFLTSTFFLVLFSLFTPVYETNDDVTMTLIANGAYTGEPSSYLVYINIILGKFLALLYRAYPNWNWYSTLFYGVAFVSLYSILAIVVNKIKNKLLLVISLSFLIIFYLRFLLFLQFTTTAAIAATSGILLFLFHVSSNKKHQLFSYLIAYSLLLISSLIRIDAFYLIIILAIPVIIAVYKQHAAKRKTIIAFLFIVMLGVTTTKYIHDTSYNKDPDWNNYFIFHNSLEELINAREFYNYDQNKHVYDNIGWSKNDYLMFHTEFYYDENIYSAEKLQPIVSSIKYRKINLIILQDTFLRLLSNILRIGPFILIVMLLSTTSWILMKNKLYFISILAIGLFIFIFFSYWRYLPERVLLPISFFIGFSSLFFTSNYNGKLNGLKISKTLQPYLFYSLLYILLTTILLFITYYSRVNYENKNKIASLKASFEYLPDKDALVFIWNSILPFKWRSPFDNYLKFKDHTILFGGWIHRTPHDRLVLKKFDINNIYTALYEHNNIYLVTFPSHTELLRIFMKEHYNKDIYFESLHEFKFYNYSYTAQLFKVKLENHEKE